MRADHEDIKRLFNITQDRDKKLRDLELLVKELREELRTELGKRKREDNNDGGTMKKKKLDDIQQ